MKLPAPKKAKHDWYIQLRINGKSTIVRGSTPKECTANAANVKAGLQTVPDKSSLTLSEAIDRYIDDRSNVLSPSTIRGYRTIQNNRFQSLMGKKCFQIKTQDVRSAVNQEAKTVSAKTIKNSYGLICAVLREYDVDVTGVRLPQVVQTERDFLEPEQICILIDAIRGNTYELPILLQLWLGLRRSEAMAVYWEDFNFQKKTLHIQRTIVQGEDQLFVERHATKTAGSNRTLSVPDYILSRLEALQPDPEKRSGRIFVRNPHTYERQLSQICKSAGLPNIGTHGLRHTNASVMLELGITAKLAMARGGWTSERTMQQIYQHLFSSAKDSADDAINSYFEALASKNDG